MLEVKDKAASTGDGKKHSPAPVPRLIPEERLPRPAELSAGKRGGESRKRHVLYPPALTKPSGFVCLVSPAL